MKITLADLPKLVAKYPELKIGAVIDTNALFAASMPLDRLNTWAETTFEKLDDLAIPVFTNINIRSEFLDLQRRVLIPEGLVALYDQSENDEMEQELRTQLKLLKTKKDRTAKAENLFKFGDHEIKKYRSLLNRVGKLSDDNSWDTFCMGFLHQTMKRVWDDAIGALKIKFVGTRTIERQESFTQDPNWHDMVDIIGKFGIGSSDAMIINFFLCSKFQLIVTGDEDVAYVIEKLAPTDKYIIVPSK